MAENDRDQAPETARDRLRKELYELADTIDLTKSDPFNNRSHFA